MKAFLINPYDETVTEIDDDFKGDYRRTHHHLSEPGRHEVDCATTVPISGGGDIVLVDDNGMCSPGHACWTFDGADIPLAGRGLLIGTDREGDYAAPNPGITLDLLKSKVVWLHLNSTGRFAPTTEETREHPVLGNCVHIIQGGPVLAHPEEVPTV
jgi:hypothetical protein